MPTTIEDKNKLKKQVLESLFELKEIQSSLTNDNIAADIINVVCKYIITNKNVTYKTSAEPMDSFLYNWDNCSPFVRDVVLSLRNELYGIISEQTSEALTQNICFNLGWSEMPAFLDNYFSEKHVQTLNEDKEIFDFMSISHERYVNGFMVAGSKVDRNIKIVCWNNRKDMTIEIFPTLSLKKSHLENKFDNLYIYRGEDSDYIFEVKYDEFDDITYVSVSLLSRHLKLSFY